MRCKVVSSISVHYHILRKSHRHRGLIYLAISVFISNQVLSFCIYVLFTLQPSNSHICSAFQFLCLCTYGKLERGYVQQRAWSSRTVIVLGNTAFECALPDILIFRGLLNCSQIFFENASVPYNTARSRSSFSVTWLSHEYQLMAQIDWQCR